MLFGILLNQAVGEYDERAKSNGLDIIINQPKEPIVIMGDRKHLWRILDNLMNNYELISEKDKTREI